MAAVTGSGTSPDTGVTTPGDEASATGRPLCPGCGVHAPQRETTCQICGTAVTEPLRSAPQLDHDLFWVGVQCSFECRVCGHRSPLNHLDLDGSVMCLNCGIEQKFDEKQWWAGIDHAHAVGDLAGPDPEGRRPNAATPLGERNPFRQIGIDRTFAEEQQRGVVISGRVTTHSLAVRAMPGHPLCRNCRVPVVLTKNHEERIGTRCPRCNDEREYQRPGGIPKKRKRKLRGVVAGEHLVGQRDAELEQNAGGATLVKCPNCHAPLEARGDSSLLTCSYCSATSRLSPTTLRQLGHRDLQPELWWMLFSGESSLRRELRGRAEQERVRAEQKARRWEQVQREHQRRGEGQSRPSATAKEQPPQRGAPGRAATKPRKKKPGQASTAVAVGLTVAAMTLGGGYALYMRLQDAAAVTARPSAARLHEFSFDLSPHEAAALFAVEAKNDMSVDFSPSDVIRHARIVRGGGPAYSITLTGGEAFDLDAAKRRMKELSPHRLRGGAALEVNAAKSLLRYSPIALPQTRGKVEAMTWIQDDGRAKAQINALWALARYVATGQPRPTADQLKRLNGPQLTEIDQLDPKVPIEGAAEAFDAIFPSGGCTNVTDAMTGVSRLVCETEVDHGRVQKLQLAWTNAKGATLESAHFRFWFDRGAAEPVHSCLEQTLGQGEKVVVDHGSGRGHWLWKLGEAGDVARVDGSQLVIESSKEREITTPPGWTQHLKPIVTVLEACQD